MPRYSEGPKRDMHLESEEILFPSYAWEYQAHWYKLAASYIHATRHTSPSVLDVGAGAGICLKYLRQGTSGSILGIDLCKHGPEVLACSVEQMPSQVWDWVLAIDVVEHVQDDAAFMQHLARVAKRYVFISTPNWDVWHARNPYHVREYQVWELPDLGLCAGLQPRRLFVSDANCRIYNATFRAPPRSSWLNFAMIYRV